MMGHEPSDRAVHRAYLATLLTVLDSDCDRVHNVLRRVDDPQLAEKVAHLIAHRMIAVVVGGAGEAGPG
jgi:hypothetical protein